MRPLRQVDQAEVRDHWQTVEKKSSADFRSDIRAGLPGDLLWYCCAVEPADCEKLYIISSRDWGDISGFTFRAVDVAARLDLPTDNANTQRIAGDIRKKISHLETGGVLDTQLIAITDSPSLSGPFKLIEGNGAALRSCGGIAWSAAPASSAIRHKSQPAHGHS